jgi:hypothetical protein
MSWDSLAATLIIKYLKTHDNKKNFCIGNFNIDY